MAGGSQDNGLDGHKKYSTAFEKLAGDGNDLIGLVAYALYKRHKRAWIIEANPGDRAIQDHHHQIVDPYIKSLRDTAHALLAKYGDERVEEAKPHLMTAGYDYQVQGLSNQIEESQQKILKKMKSQTNPWHTFLPGLAVWFVGVIVSVVLVVSNIIPPMVSYLYRFIQGPGAGG